MPRPPQEGRGRTTAKRHTPRVLERWTILLAMVAAVPACTSAPTTPTESDVNTCSNGRDDDGDGATDCRDLACTVFPFCAGTDAGIDSGPLPDVGPRPDAGCDPSLDLVLSIDVSTSMTGELMAVRDGVPRIFAPVRTTMSASNRPCGGVKNDGSVMPSTSEAARPLRSELRSPAESELLQPVVRSLGQRVGIIKPERTEGRIPDESAAY